jgi:hypothetical protein
MHTNFWSKSLKEIVLRKLGIDNTKIDPEMSERKGVKWMNLIQQQSFVCSFIYLGMP